MIIYQETISEFIFDCETNRVASKILVALKDKRGINGVSKKEKDSWKNTLPSVARVLNGLNYKKEQYVLLEFVICDSSKRIDLMIVGKNEQNSKNLIIAEIKGWSSIDLYEDSDLLNPHLKYGLCNHPSSEAYDYYYLLTNRYSDIVSQFVLMPIAFLPNYNPSGTNVLKDKRFSAIVNHANVYSQDNIFELKVILKNNFNTPININDVNALDGLEYKPSINFINHLKNEFKQIRLIGSQKVAFENFKLIINNVLNENKKNFFIISGGAGSGKTIVAFKILNYLLSNKFDVRMILPGPEFREAVMKNFSHLRTSDFINGANSKLVSDVIIIDEAHKATGQDNASVFYNRILANTRKIVIALIDNHQVINKKGITLEELVNKAESNNYVCHKLELTEQFRNGGDASYTNWLKNIIFKEANHQEWFINKFFDFKILNDTEFNNLYHKMYNDHNIRIVSFWTQTWDLNALNPTVKIGNTKYIWNPNWQWLQKYLDNGNKMTKELQKLCKDQNFNLDKKGSQYIGYFNSVQGYEFDYIFVHIPKLFFLNEANEVDVNLSMLDMSEMKSQIWATDSIADDLVKNKKIQLNKQYFLNRLFVNLTRGTKGAYVYIEDIKLCKFIQSKLKNI